ncbi:hypothetical protein GH733_006081 [Mirounga leonina]|nr:hypothetical protein GH733_006081 [Mirounga leonina]
MAPVRQVAEWSAGDFETRSQGVSSVGFKNKNVKQRTWRSNHPQAFAGSVREGISITISKKNKKKTSNQKAQEEYEQIQAERAAKKQEFEKRKQEREEAQRLYKKKKMEAFKILSKKTKKGQPNLNLQMEYLLKKIQEKN